MLKTSAQCCDCCVMGRKQRSCWSGSLQTDCTERCVELNGRGQKPYGMVQRSDQDTCLLTVHTSYEVPSDLQCALLRWEQAVL